MSLLTNFIHYITFEKRYSVHTVDAYQSDIEQFFLFAGIEESVSINSVSSSIVRAWIINLSTNKNSARSIRRKIASLNSFFRWAVRQQHLDANPCKLITLPKTDKKLPEFAEEKKLIQSLDVFAFGEDFEGVRNHLIIEMFYSTGMRLSELTGLKNGDVDISSGYIKVHGKRNKERMIPVTGILTGLCEKYILLRAEITSDEKSFFVTPAGKPVYAKLVYRVVHSFLSVATTLNKKSPHILRHTFATHMLNHGADINAIKELLGHANLAATQVYTHNSFEKLKKVYQQAHPRA
ncbi:MAG: integrase [Bacteroidetes bacterium HGW-Bacteroidetes-21]|jgi:integrase/recombinase XerC|nr:MAG: integrase [Bacteroidetes bacterium HGW-Bacteroidetes-21]